MSDTLPSPAIANATNNKPKADAKSKVPINLEELKRLKQAKKEAKKKLDAAKSQQKAQPVPPKVLERVFEVVPHRVILDTVVGEVRVMTFNVGPFVVMLREI